MTYFGHYYLMGFKGYGSSKILFLADAERLENCNYA